MKVQINVDYGNEYGSWKPGDIIDTSAYPGLAERFATPSTSYTILEDYVPTPKPPEPEADTTTAPEGLPSILEEIDAMTVREASELIAGITDIDLLKELDNGARLKGVRSAADARLQTLMDGGA